MSQWQERRHTLKTINALLMRSKGNTEGIVVTETNHSISIGKAPKFNNGRIPKDVVFSQVSADS